MLKTPVIEFRHVSYSQPSQTILSDIHSTIYDGEYVGVVGPNGGGKTTLVKLLLGLLTPTSGEILVCGQPVSDPQSRVGVGYVPQRVALQENVFPASVTEVILTGLLQSGALRFFSQKKHFILVRAALEAVGIAHLQDRRVNDLSGGERQRVFIARALAAHPKILVLDEPTVGVDPKASENFYALLKRLHRELQITIVLISHDLDAVAQEVESVICLNQKLVCHGKPKDALTREYLNLLYGDNMQFIYHDRHEEEGKVVSSR